MAAQDTFSRELQVKRILLEDVSDSVRSTDIEEVKLSLERVSEAVKELELKKDKVMNSMLELENESIEAVRDWAQQQKQEINPFKEMRIQLKQQISKLLAIEGERALQMELEKQRVVMEEAAKIRRKQEQHQEEAQKRQRDDEEKWMRTKLEIEQEKIKMYQLGAAQKTQTVKLQKYTITPFQGDFKDWLRFWNQFIAEVDGSGIAEISKFNYLLELVQGKPRDDILGLPHTPEGYEEAKRILTTNYGKDVKVRKALIQELESLNQVKNIHHLRDIHEFYNKLARVVRTLATMKKLDTAQSHVYSLMDKLGPVKEALVSKDDEWEEWDLECLVENLRKYVDRHPLPVEGTFMSNNSPAHKRCQESKKEPRGSDRMLLAKNTKPCCVYCGKDNHRSSECFKILDVAHRRDILKSKNLCFNCTNEGHVAAKCRSRGCRKCSGRHHTSLCDTAGTESQGAKQQQAEMGKRATDLTTTLHATVVAKVNGIPARIMVDSGASSSHICTNLITQLQLKPAKIETRSIEQMYGTVKRRVQVYKVNVTSESIDDYSLSLNCINGEKNILTYLPNPKIKELKKKYNRFRCLKFSDEDAQDDRLPIHMILGAADYQRIKTTEPPLLGPNPDVDPGAECTMLGWTLAGRMVESSLGTEKILLMVSSQDEFERMCSIEVLGLSDTDKRLDEEFHENFQKKVKRLSDGTYMTRLPWKEDIVQLPANKELAVARLYNTTRRLEKLQKLEEYEEVMKDQIKEGILEKVPEKPSGEIVHYVPHQAVIREQAESTKMRIVYDCSAKSNAHVPSLNDCLEKGPPLQPLLLDILLRNRMAAYCITGDIRKAFLQIRLDPLDRDSQRLFWYSNLEDRKLLAYRFTRIIFGSASSPYILGAVLQKHIMQYGEKYPETVETLLKNTYVDDVQFVSQDKGKLSKFKKEASQILQDGGFTLHKWHSNIPEVDVQASEASKTSQEDAVTYAKTTVGAQSNETKILGIPWNKKSDEFIKSFAKCIEREQNGALTKRKMLSIINGVFDPLGLVSPVIVAAKVMCSQVCQKKLAWDEEIKGEIASAWKNWIKCLTKNESVSFPRSVAKGTTVSIVLHGFSDASKLAVAACIYIITRYENQEAQQHLIMAKSRIAPEKPIPRLELIAAHMLSKLIAHVKSKLEGYPIEQVHGWVDSTTVLYWIKGKGTWSQFVRNRIKAINDSGVNEWHYVPTDENPSDLGSRGSSAKQLGTFWFCGPCWLTKKEMWPSQPVIRESAEAETERVPKQQIQMFAKEEKIIENTIDGLLQKHLFWKTMRITAYILRFINNCKGKEKQKGTLTTDEVQSAETVWVKRVQNSQELKCDIELKQDAAGIWRCAGRVPNYHPTFLPRNHKFVKLLIDHYHKRLLHGGVSVTMCSIRERFWISKLRSLVKKMVHECNHCKKFRVKALAAPAKSLLPDFRSTLTTPFEYTGVDFAGPIIYRENKKTIAKAYVALFTCSTTRAVHLKLCKDLTADEFKRALKEFVARRGTPKAIISDNGRTFVATSKWFKRLKKNEELTNYMATQRILWKFNLSRAPWWGGFFERLIGIMKRSLAKAIGRSMLKFPELEEILLDVECSMNNRPLCYQGEEFQEPVITTNMLIRGQPANLLEEDLSKVGNEEELAKKIVLFSQK